MRRTVRHRVLVTLASALCLFGVAAHAAHAALPPEALKAARENADHHLQFRVTHVIGLPFWRGRGNCQVTGEVTRVFRGPVEPGTYFLIRFPCHQWGMVPAGPTIWTNAASLRNADRIEAFLNGPADDLRLARDQYGFLSGDATSDQPACTVDDGCP